MDNDTVENHQMFSSNLTAVKLMVMSWQLKHWSCWDRDITENDEEQYLSVPVDSRFWEKVVCSSQGRKHNLSSNRFYNNIGSNEYISTISQISNKMYWLITNSLLKTLLAAARASFES